MNDPHDQAAILLLRATLEDLAAGATYCTAHAAEELQGGAYRLSVTVKPREPSEMVPGGTVSGGGCPTCGGELVDASGTVLCPRCGPPGQLPAVEP